MDSEDYRKRIDALWRQLRAKEAADINLPRPGLLSLNDIERLAHCGGAEFLWDIRRILIIEDSEHFARTCQIVYDIMMLRNKSVTLEFVKRIVSIVKSIMESKNDDN